MEEFLTGYPVVIQLLVAWGDMDAMQHVNNTVYFRYFESGRIAYFEQLELMDRIKETGIGPILASASCRFKFPLTYPDTISVGVRVTDMGEDRFTMAFRVVSHRHQRVAAEGDGLIVTYDYQAGRKAPIPAEVRARIQALEGAG